MSETLTYDPGTDTVTTENNLTPEEQDSLKVGEELESQQDQLLAGKYKDAQELEKAYVELQKKLGETEDSKTESKEDSKEDSKEEDSETNEYGLTIEEQKQKEKWEEETGLEMTPAAALISQASKEFTADGKIDDNTLAKFNDLDSQELISTYMQMYNKGTDLLSSEEQQAQIADIDPAAVNSIKQSVGGDEAYGQLLNWASQNLNQSTVDSFDKLIKTGDAEAIQLAVNGLKMQYDNVNGYEGRMLTGKAPQNSRDVFRSQAQLVEAMSDPRYETDEAYRQDVRDKLNRSDQLTF